MTRLLEAEQTLSQNRNAALVVATAALLLCLVRYIYVAIQATWFPFEIDYGEGIVWEQMHLVMEGKAYGSIDGYPSIAFPYPPFYNIVTDAFARMTGLDELAAGRLVSILSALATAFIVAAILPQLARSPAERKSYRIAGVLAGLMALATQPMLQWSILMRVDLLFVALTFAGLFFGLRAFTRPREIYIAGVLFVAAIYTKQIAIAAPCAVFGTMLFLRPRTAWAGIATCLLLGLAILGPIMAATDGGFLRHILTYTINAFRWSQVLDILEAFGVHIGYCAVAILGIRARLHSLPPLRSREALQAWRRHLAANDADARFVTVLIYLLLASLMLITSLKSGSSINYFLEWGCLITLFAGLALCDNRTGGAGGQPSSRTRRLAALAPWIVAIQAFRLSWTVGKDLADKAGEMAGMERLVRLVADAPHPVISDDMVAVVRAGKRVQWEPFIFAELAKKGVWNERLLTDRILAGRFAFLVTQGFPGDRDIYDERYTPTVTAAIEAAYPQDLELGGYTLHFPRGRLPDYAADLVQ